MGIYRIAALAAAVMLPVVAGAHQGAHADQSGAAAMLWHLISQPDHALMLLGAVFAGIYLYRKRRLQKY